MSRADVLLATCAMAGALLAGASGAVAAADTGDPAASESTKVSDSASGGDQSPDQADHADPHTYSSDDSDRAADTQSGDVGPDDAGGAPESGDEQSDEKNPADNDAGSDHGDKTINRIPVLIPEAPPFVDLGPIPEELPPLPLEPMPPVDLPPALPATPIEPDVVDVTMVGPSAGRPDGNAPPVLTVPVIVAPVLSPPLHVLGASVAPRGTSAGQAVTSTSRSGDAPAPSLHRAATSGPLSRESPPANVGLSGRQPSNRTGFKNADLHRGRLADVAAGALPGVAGILIMTASGICLGYRQATAAQQLQPQGAHRFLA
jgi:hypothetical protein